MSKRTMAISLIAAFAMAIIISMTMTSPAMAAQKKPYKGYQIEDTYPVYDASGNYQYDEKYIATYGAGCIELENVGDTRRVPEGFLGLPQHDANQYGVYSYDCDSITVWSGSSYKAPLSNFTSKYTNPDGTPAADVKTIVDNTSQFKKLKGLSYNKKKNTLTLNNVKAPAYKLKIYGMGTGFKIIVKGKKNQLAGIEVYARQNKTAFTVIEDGVSVTRVAATGYNPCSVKIDGTGKLVVNKKKYEDQALYVNGGGYYSAWNAEKATTESQYAYTKSKLTITKKPSVQLYAYGANGVAFASNSAAKKPISISGVKKGVLEGASVKTAASANYGWEEIDVTGDPYGASYRSDAMKLNDGAFYGVENTNGAWYFDTKTRQRCYTSWLIYQKTGVGKYGDVTATYIGMDSNVKDHPAHYTPIVNSVNKAHYNYVVKNSKLVAGK